MGSLTTRKSYGLKGYMPLSHVSGDEWGLEATASSLPAKWLQSFKAATQVQERCSGTTLVSVGDREADIYELFHLALTQVRQVKIVSLAT